MTVTPVKPISPKAVAEAKELVAKVGKIEQEIINRIDYIMSFAFYLFNKKDCCWYFYGAEEGEVGNLWRGYQDETIDTAVECSGEMVILLKDGSEWGLTDSIPTRWLYEPFEDEMTKGKEAYEEKIERKKRAAKAQKLKKQKADKDLAEKAKAKLSKEELAALMRTK